ncbi:MAG: metallophosphoesterase family protein [Candidatus Hydrogenedentes bacterium]|nr:metallophosphoesterase family protein [Candidatus Hydrogenedentota bacterium]
MDVGLIADTHTVLRPQVITAFRGVTRILHAGDVGSPLVLAELQTIAPVTAVRGNVDQGRWADQLSDTEIVEVGGVLIYLLHDLEDLPVDPYAAGFAAVVFGHSHKPETHYRDGVLYVNPGSAGPRRFANPITVARLQIAAGTVRPEIISLETPVSH